MRPEALDRANINAWRKRQRTRLAAQRANIGTEERQRAESAIVATIGRQFQLHETVFAIYWPLPGELDLRPLVDSALLGKAQAALPVIVEKNRPLEFWRWSRQSETTSSGLWGIPVPVERHPVIPSIVFVPMLGFDSDCHRLGYGGGYYDRTLAILPPDTVSVGIGFEFGRLPTIYPQAHDIAMNAIVTERGVSWNPLKAGPAM